MTDVVVSKFGGTSVADFDAMNRSADVVLSDANVRVVVLSASAGITNLLVALAGANRALRKTRCHSSNSVQYSGTPALSKRDP